MKSDIHPLLHITHTLTLHLRTYVEASNQIQHRYKWNRIGSGVDDGILFFVGEYNFMN